MRRFALLALLPLLAGMASCRQAASTGSLPAKIALVRVGFLPGPLAGVDDLGRRTEPMYKAGHWTPVLVTLEGRGLLDGAEIVTQTVDANDVLNDYAVRLPALDFDSQSQYTFMTYARPGKIESAVSVSLRAKGQTVTFPDKASYAQEPNSYLYATFGARLPGMRLPGMEEKTLRRTEVVAVDQAGDMPTRWLGYHTIDLALLTTGNDEFLSKVLNDTERRTALVDWVRRGGRLVLTVGANQNLLQNREELREFLPVDFGGTVTTDLATFQLGTKSFDELGDPTKKTPLTIAKMTAKPDRNVRELSKVQIGALEHPLIVQAAFGLGRITVMAVDPDLPPFTRWKKQGEFWEKLLREAGPHYAAPHQEAGFGGFNDGTHDDLLFQVQNRLEQFDGVPVISFAWVALFILLYIIVVGPLDYLFLKKVVKRLELTWVTFPLVVLAVSAAAYLTAHALKGNDQKVNKIDLIDFDLQGKAVQGHTWFAIFSPRVQNYTIGVEPAEGWGIKEAVSPPTVSWLGRPSSSGRQSLFRRSYDYDTTAGGLRRVPIQVWSAASFQGSWESRLDPGKLPLTVNLRAVGERDQVSLTGSIVSNLPVELRNAVVLYQSKVYLLETLYPGATKQLAASQRKELGEWKSFQGVAAPRAQQQPMWGRGPQQTNIEASDQITRQIMFHEKFEEGGSRTTRNADFRALDQSWRLANDDPGGQAIIYGTLATTPSGPAEDVRSDKSTVTRLWLGTLPGDSEARPALTGTMRQETHLRFFVPVKPLSK